MLLAIDVGNTRIKAAVFEGDTFLELVVFDKEAAIDTVEIILEKHAKINNIVIASVGDTDSSLWRVFKEKAAIHFITDETLFPFANLYSTPKTLGIDRLVLASGAVLQYPDQNRLVIDAGTCITYDFVNDNDEYLGGAISPGIRLRYESLHQFTAKLPLLPKASPVHMTGNSTEESIHSGVVNGIANEIDGFISRYKAQYAKFIIILTGGDAEFLAKQLKNTIFANSNFLLESLNQTFQYNQK